MMAMAHFSPRVLVVDDNHDSSDMLVEILRVYGMTAQPAYDGATALALSQTFEPDIMFLDLGMPGMDGYAVAEALRARSAERPYLVALTAWNDAASQARVRQAGFDLHLPKPSSLDCILKVIADNVPARPEH
jgi:CheY-like chemotaxis protein